MNKKPYRYQFTYDGKRYSVTGKTQQELMNRVEKKKTELKSRKKITRTMSVAEWSKEWLETYKRGTVSDKTFYDYASMINKHLQLSMPIKDVQPVHLQRIMNSLSGKSKSLNHKMLILLKQIFDAALDNQLVTMNPAAKLKMPTVTEGTHRAITSTEREYILEACKTSRAGLYIKIMLYCGLRPSEAARVMGKDIDIENRKLHVRGTKTAAADRIVPIPDPLIDDLSDVKPFEYAITNSHGNPLSATALRNMWRTFKHDLSLIMPFVPDDLQAYCMRHTYATDLERYGVPINVARRLLGHANISVTSKIYTHESDEAYNDAAQKIFIVTRTARDV